VRRTQLNNNFGEFSRLVLVASKHVLIRVVSTVLSIGDRLLCLGRIVITGTLLFALLLAWAILVLSLGISMLLTMLVLVLVANLVAGLILLTGKIRFSWPAFYWTLGRGLLVLGIFLGIYGYKLVNIDLWALGIGFISAALGFIGLEMGEKSNERMRAMADLEFDEKIAVLANGLDDPEGIFYDVRAACHLARWASDEQKRELRAQVDAYRKRIKSSPDPRLAPLGNKLDGLWTEYHMDSWN
jgi:hypothetical protein